MQTTSHILMIRPASFQFNEQTAASNDYQHENKVLTSAQIIKKAQDEFDDFVSILQDNSVDVLVVEDTATPVKPDAVFPNNWISMHEDGTVFIYPMKTPNRRLEKRADIIDTLKTKFKVKEVVDLSFWEEKDMALEGTGSMIFDHDKKLIYACLSPRTEKEILLNYAARIGYQPIIFSAFKKNGQAQYHTNVVMCVGEDFVLICLQAITDAAERNMVKDTIKKSGKTLIEISSQQLEKSFAGNMLQVRNKKGDKFLVMSERALASLNDEQLEEIQNHTDILAVSIFMIEEIGGGSARCMMAEVFLPAL